MTHEITLSLKNKKKANRHPELNFGKTKGGNVLTNCLHRNR
jgi:hypothetical protein